MLLSCEAIPLPEMQLLPDGSWKESQMVSMEWKAKSIYVEHMIIGPARYPKRLDMVHSLLTGHRER